MRGKAKPTTEGSLEAVIATKPRRTNRIKNIGKKIGKAIFLGFLLFEAGTQAGYEINTRYHQLFPSQLRKDFKKEFGIELRGYAEDIENGTHLAGISAALHRERSLPSQLNNLRIVSGNYLKQSWNQQIHSILKEEGNANYWNGEIELKSRISPSEMPIAIIHEAAHARTHDIISKSGLKQQFMKEWWSASYGINGKSDLIDVFRQVISIAHYYVDSFPLSSTQVKENYKAGFLNGYAEENIFEDIAVTCTIAQDQPMRLFELDSLKEAILNFDRRIAIAQQYGLIPPETGKYIQLHNLPLEIQRRQEELSSSKYQEQKEVNKSLAEYNNQKEYMEKILWDMLDKEEYNALVDSMQTKKDMNLVKIEAKYKIRNSPLQESIREMKESLFKEAYGLLKEHPSTVYSGNIHYLLGSFLEKQSEENYYLRKQKFYDTIREYKKALTSPTMGFTVYAQTLKNIGRLYSGEFGYERKAEIYAAALKEFEKRRNTNDIHLSKRGVNDFLEKMGEKLPK